MEMKTRQEGQEETERNYEIYVKISCDRRMFSIPCFIPFEENIYWQEICEWMIFNLKHNSNVQLNGKTLKRIKRERQKRETHTHTQQLKILLIYAFPAANEQQTYKKYEVAMKFFHHIYLFKSNKKTTKQNIKSKNVK